MHVTTPTIPDDEFIRMFEEFGPMETARRIGNSAKSVFLRRRTLERKLDRRISAPIGNVNAQTIKRRYPVRVPLSIPDGVGIIGSDAHIWPGESTTAFKGYCYLVRELAPNLVCLNGDIFDGARLSRFSPSALDRPKPRVPDELEAITESLDAIKHAARGNKQCAFEWEMGNHDLRFENRLLERSPEHEGVYGMSLADHFPDWRLSTSLWINDKVVVKHRFKGGIHATQNNTLWAGMTMCTGHLHSLKVTPFDDYNGTRYGVDTGTLAEPDGPHADYTEDNPLNHRSGFVVLTFFKGKLLLPEIAKVFGPGLIEFRGKVFKV